MSGRVFGDENFLLSTEIRLSLVSTKNSGFQYPNHFKTLLISSVETQMQKTFTACGIFHAEDNDAFTSSRPLCLRAHALAPAGCRSWRMAEEKGLCAPMAPDCFSINSSVSLKTAKKVREGMMIWAWNWWNIEGLFFFFLLIHRPGAVVLMQLRRSCPVRRTEEVSSWWLLMPLWKHWE